MFFLSEAIHSGNPPRNRQSLPDSNLGLLYSITVKCAIIEPPRHRTSTYIVDIQLLQISDVHICFFKHQCLLVEIPQMCIFRCRCTFFCITDESHTIVAQCNHSCLSPVTSFEENAACGSKTKFIFCLQFWSAGDIRFLTVRPLKRTVSRE
jgi:hypothetical protein